MEETNMDIKYTVTFFSNWHCGSGLAAGADMDMLVVKDSMGLPYIPGKTMKGLLRENVDMLCQFSQGVSEEDINKAFGHFRNANDVNTGNLFFTNAELPLKERQAIIRHNAAEFLYQAVASTAIDNNGIAKDHSLRKIQVVVPCVLEGTILNVPEGMDGCIAKGLKMIKRLGHNRNRGLGRCQIEIMTEGGSK